ncbi:unnamed protein product [Malus baccata var. baccata]
MAPNSNRKSIIPPQVKCAFKPRKPRMRVIKKFKVFRFTNLPEEEESQHFTSSGSEIKRCIGTPQHDDPFEYAHSPDHSGYVTCEPGCCELDDDAVSNLPESQEGYEHHETCQLGDDHGEDYKHKSSQLDDNDDILFHSDDDLEDVDCQPENHVTCEPESCELDDDAASNLPESQEGYEHHKTCQLGYDYDEDYECESSQLDDIVCHSDDDLEDADCQAEYHEVVRTEPEDDYEEPYSPEPEEKSADFYGSQVKPFSSPCDDDDDDDDTSDAAVDSTCDSTSSHESELECETCTQHSHDYGSLQLDDGDDSFCPLNSPEPLSPPRPEEYFDCKLCVKMARESVVTPCGHLFCGDCLDKWLNFFTSEMECPVCRSKVLGSSIIPISPPPWWQLRP